MTRLDDRAAGEPSPSGGAAGAYVPVAVVARPHGLRGEVRLKLYNEESSLLSSRPPIRLRMPDGTERPAALTGVRAANKAVLLKLAGVDDCDAAELLRGAVVCVPRASFPPAEEGEFYACDLEGARVVMTTGEAIGKVTGIQSYPTCDALLVDRDGGGRLEVPLVDAYVASVDVEGAVVELSSIEGLS